MIHAPCLAYHIPDLADVPSRKRADTRRRGQLLGLMTGAMRTRLGALLAAPGQAQ